MGRNRIVPLIRRTGVREGGTVGTLAPTMAGLVHWYRPEERTIGAAAVWLDQGSLGEDLAGGPSNDPADGVAIDGLAAMTGNGQRSYEGTLTSMSGAREYWLVVRSDAHSTQLAMDALSGTNRNTIFVDSGDDINFNSGSTLDETTDGFREHRPEILRFVNNGDNTGEIYRCDSAGNTISALTSGNVGTTAFDGITLGAANTGSTPWKGEIAEVLLYSAVLSDSDAQATHAYLASRYPSTQKRSWTPEVLMCVGDSHTAGTNEQTDGRGYRSGLHRAFEILDIDEGGTPRTIVFHGTTEDSCLDHAGVSGDTVSDVNARVAAAIASDAPDVLVLLVGTNDCQDAGYATATFNSDYDTLLATINTSDATLPIVLCLIPPLANSTHNTNVDDANNELTKTDGNGIIENASSTIVTVDLNSITTVGTHLGDGVHANDTGAALWAAAIVAGIRTAVG